MISFSVLHIGQYTHPEKNRQQLQHVFLSFYIQGSKWRQTNGILNDDLVTPYFSIGLPGDIREYEYGSTRENWVIQLNTSDIRHSSKPDFIDIKFEENWITVPKRVYLEKEIIPGWRTEFYNMRELFKSPIPRDCFAMKLGISNVLREFLKSPDMGYSACPAQELKRMIDQDRNVELTLEQMSDKIGFSTDHLRRLFEKKFQVSPQVYRNQRQMTIVMDLISNSVLSVKEIAAQTGFKHMSHLSGRFRKQYGITPSEGIKQFRNIKRF